MTPLALNILRAWHNITKGVNVTHFLPSDVERAERVVAWLNGPKTWEEASEMPYLSSEQLNRVDREMIAAGAQAHRGTDDGGACEASPTPPFKEIGAAFEAILERDKSTQARLADLEAGHAERTADASKWFTEAQCLAKELAAANLEREQIKRAYDVELETANRLDAALKRLQRATGDTSWILAATREITDESQRCVNNWLGGDGIEAIIRKHAMMKQGEAGGAESANEASFGNAASLRLTKGQPASPARAAMPPHPIEHEIHAPRGIAWCYASDTRRALTARDTRIDELERDLFAARNDLLREGMERDAALAEIERLSTALENTRQQARQQAQEARTQHAIVVSLCRIVGVPETDFEAERNVGAEIERLRATIAEAEKIAKSSMPDTEREGIVRLVAALDTRYNHEREVRRLNLATIAALTRERDEAKRELQDVLFSKTVKCVWCDEVFGDGVGVETHYKTCPKHPMRALEAENARLRECIDTARTWAVEGADNSPIGRGETLRKIAECCRRASDPNDPSHAASGAQRETKSDEWIDSAADDILSHAWTTSDPMTEERVAGIIRKHAERGAFDLVAHLHRQRAFSERTFGPGTRAHGVIDHIRKELAEIEANPGDLSEWIDVVLLALDGAWRGGNSPEQIARALEAKQTKNEARSWPDWRTAEPGKAIEHVRTSDFPAGSAGQAWSEEQMDAAQSLAVKFGPGLLTQSYVREACAEIARVAPLFAPRPPVHEAAPAALGWNVIEHAPEGAVLLSAKQRDDVQRELAARAQRISDLKFALGDNAGWFDRARIAEAKLAPRPPVAVTRERLADMLRLTRFAPEERDESRAAWGGLHEDYQRLWLAEADRLLPLLSPALSALDVERACEAAAIYQSEDPDVLAWKEMDEDDRACCRRGIRAALRALGIASEGE